MNADDPMGTLLASPGVVHDERTGEVAATLTLALSRDIWAADPHRGAELVSVLVSRHAGARLGVLTETHPSAVRALPRPPGWSVLAQVTADRPRGVGLVGADSLGAGPRPARADTVDVQVRHQVREHRGVAGLAGSDEYDQRTAVSVNELVDLRGQAAAGTTHGVIGRLDAQILVVRSCPVCPGTGSRRADGRE